MHKACSTRGVRWDKEYNILVGKRILRKWECGLAQHSVQRRAVMNILINFRDP
jgi:hypothetical protein